MAIYPTAAATDSDLYTVVNQLSTVLNGSLDAVQTTVTVTSTTGFPTVGFITVDSEVIKYTSINATQFLGCTRGADGTSATTHSSGATVKHSVVAAHHNALKDEVIAIETDLINSTNSKFGMKNRQINGDMRIDQERGGTAITANNAILAYVPDQFLGLSNFGGALEGTMSFQRVSATPPAGFTHYTRATVVSADASIAAGNAYEYLTSIEGTSLGDFDLGKATARIFTLSFWVRSSITGTFGGGLINGGQTRSYVFQYTINAANTWERKSVTLTGDITGTWSTANDRGIQIFWDLGSGTNFNGTANVWQAGSFFRASGNTQFITNAAATWDMTGVQVELGSSATAFEFRSFPEELILCQRHYEKSYELETAVGTSTAVGAWAGPGAITNTATVRYGAITFKVHKRIIPTVRIWNNVGTADAIITTSPTDVNTSRAAIVVTTTLHSFGVRQSVTSADTYCGAVQFDASARLQ